MIELNLCPKHPSRTLQGSDLLIFMNSLMEYSWYSRLLPKIEMIPSLSEETIFSFSLTTIVRTRYSSMYLPLLGDNKAHHKEKILAQWLSPLKTA